MSCAIGVVYEMFRASKLLGRATGLFTQEADVRQRVEDHNPLKELTIEELKMFLEEVKKRESLEGEMVESTIKYTTAD